MRVEGTYLQRGQPRSSVCFSCRGFKRLSCASKEDEAKQQVELEGSAENRKKYIDQILRYEEQMQKKGRVALSDSDLGKSVGAKREVGMGGVENFGNLWPTKVYEDFWKVNADPQKIVSISFGNGAGVVQGFIFGPEKGARFSNL